MKSISFGGNTWICTIRPATCTDNLFPAIILASLSRGGQIRYGAKAQVGIIGIVLTAVIISIYLFMLYEYGSIEGIFKAYSDMTGIDYNQLLQQ